VLPLNSYPSSMKSVATVIGIIFVLFQNRSMAEPIPLAARLQKIVDESVAATLEQFSTEKLESNQLAVTLIDLKDAAHPEQGGFRAEEPIYPASVIKLFYLVAAHRWMEDGRLADTGELRRALRDMIVDSSNDATHYVVDAITGTTAGPELPPEEMKAWAEKRNMINRYFASLGFSRINANQKPWCEGPYGREREFVGKSYANRNVLTTEATARLLTEIVLGKAVSSKRSDEMMQILKRDPSKKVISDEPDQGTEFTAKALPPEAKLWSKAGWTSTARHDAAYIELPAGAKFVLVTFTTGHSKNSEIIPFLARKVIERLLSEPAK
jgi:beta-lactamase class A